MIQYTNSSISRQFFIRCYFLCNKAEKLCMRNSTTVTNIFDTIKLVNPFNMPSQKVNLFLCFCGLVCVSSMEDVWVELRAPRFVVHGHTATLKCDHNVDPETLYKVVFFKNGQRIMQYVQGRDPPFELFNFTGAYINLIQMDSTSITLDKMDFPASGTYACEIALEIPLYSKASKVQEVNVIVRQKHRPKIKVKHKNRKFLSQDDLKASCQSAPAYPAPHLTWFINNEKVDERLIIPHGTVLSNRYHHGMPLSQTNSSLILPLNDLQLLSNEAIVITCLSTIPSYAYFNEGFADIQNHTITVNVVRMEPTPTQLPVKIVSPDTSRSSPKFRYNSFIVIIIAITNLNV